MNKLALTIAAATVAGIGSAQVLDGFENFNWRDLSIGQNENFARESANGYVGTSTGLGGPSGRFQTTGGEESRVYRHRLVGSGTDTVFNRDVNVPTRYILFRFGTAATPVADIVSAQSTLSFGIGDDSGAANTRWASVKAINANQWELRVEDNAGNFGGSNFSSQVFNAGQAGTWYQLAYDWTSQGFRASVRDHLGQNVFAQTGFASTSLTSAFVNIRGRNDGTDSGNAYTWNVDNIGAVPEPGTLAALGIGALAMAARRRKKAQS